MERIVARCLIIDQHEPVSFEEAGRYRTKEGKRQSQEKIYHREEEVRLTAARFYGET